MHILVTGGAGFIGSNLIPKLLEQRHTVSAIDNFSAGEASRRRAKLLKNEYDIKVAEGEARFARTTIMNIGERFDAIVHLAAPISVNESLEKPDFYCQEINAATRHVLEAAVLPEINIKRVILASTAAVYGNLQCLPLAEDRVDPRTPYAIEKFAAEGHARLFAEQRRLETVILRFFNAYGPGQDPSSPYSGVISKFMERVAQKEPPVIFGDGAQTRDLVSVDDIADAIILALTRDVTPGLTVNIGSGKATTVNDVARAVIRLNGNKLKPKYAPERTGDITHSVADISKAEAALGYAPKVSLEEGLRRTWDWYQSSRSAP